MMYYDLKLVFYAIQVYLFGLFRSGICDGKTLSSEICATNAVELRCGQDEHVVIKNIVCGTGSHACAPFVNRTIYDVCNGQSYCGDLDIRSMVDVYCTNPVKMARKVLLSYQCVEGKAQACRVNVCPESSPGLKCADNGVIHVKSILCKDDSFSCSWETYVTFYTLCEARSECSAAALQSLLPGYCQNKEIYLRNVLVDYICLKEAAVENVCSSTVRKLKESYGIVLSPGFIDDTTPASSHCYWSIDPFPATMVKVMVHMAYHKDSMPQCAQKFLQIQYTDCNTGRIDKGSFCDIRKNNQEILSCGTVYVNNVMSSLKQPDYSDKYLISYQVSNTSVGQYFGDAAVEQCGNWLITPTPAAAPAPTPRRGSHDDTINAIFDYTLNTSTKPHDPANTVDAYSILRKLKLIFLYIFFGLIISALLISLVMVIISYKKVDKRSNNRRDKSEKVILWNKDDSHRNGDTPMETFRHNSVAETAISGQTESVDIAINHYDVLVPTQKRDGTAIATIHLHSENDKRLSAGSGFSSFRPSNRNSDLSSGNPYASYSSLNSSNSPQYYGRASGPNNGYVHNTLNGHTRGTASPARNSERQPLVYHSNSPVNADDVEHYTINEDDYAIVKKPRLPTDRPSNNLSDDLEPTYDNLYDRDIGRFRPTSGPYDKYRNSEVNFRFKPPYHPDDDL